ncbi:hypothetical protein TrST_g6980 [Triparma strigata]|uniref:Golgi apparatus membrane protein TVP23 homolog n=1 Tax=Triparma strigata TaxID=1606541 RepID=A0A9W7EHS8_9STRA|nr:hypothetical protein TrST_g6980 [Triparma strigata]
MATDGPETLDFVNIPQQTSSSTPLSLNPSTSNSSIPNPSSQTSLPPPSIFTSPTSTISTSSHPSLALLHLLSKSVPVLLYIFGTVFTSNFIFLFVLLILLLASDFWLTKNVTGRRLVGLRWWSTVNEDGSTQWIYESSDHQNPNKSDSSIFWTFLYLPFLVWSLFLVLGFVRLKFQWLPICLVSLSLSGANIYGYYKCSKEQKGKLDYLVKQGMEEGLRGAMGSGAFRGAVWDVFTTGNGKGYETVPGQQV